MKSSIYGLLFASTLIEPTFCAAGLRTDNTVCSDELSMKQLRELQSGKLTLNKIKFSLHTPQEEFDSMLPKNPKLQVISEATSVAKIAKKSQNEGREILDTYKGKILLCRYTFRTAMESKTGGKHKTFEIISE